MIVEDVANVALQAMGWRRDIHRNPELLYDVPRTASLVADLLTAFGCDSVSTGIGRSGVVGVIQGRGHDGQRAVAIRADMDALPIEEAGCVEYRSGCPGKMHACGHDGHTAILLGAAQHLAKTRDFDGAAVLVFQPAEEGGKGAQAMIEDGLMERFAIDEVFALHNLPGLPVGHFAIRCGAIMAASDRFEILIEGRGGHAARPQECVDPVLVSAHVVTALQSVVARNIDPLQAAVLTIGAVQAGTTYNVIPQCARLLGTVRALDDSVRKTCEDRIRQIARTVCEAFGAASRITYTHGHPVTSNHPAQTRKLIDAAASVVGQHAIETQTPPLMASEDFGFMLRERPGAYIFLGNGDSRPLHHAAYDFNDDALRYGIALWVALVQSRLRRA